MYLFSLSLHIIILGIENKKKYYRNIFSILFHKQFVSFGKEKRKVEALLSEFDLSNRLVEKAEEIEKVFMQEIDGNAIEQKLKEKREVSYSYLEKYLDK